MKKKLTAIAALIIVTVAACAPTGHGRDATDVCKDATTRVYDDLNATKTVDQLFATAAKYGVVSTNDQSSETRDVLPQCKVLSREQNDKVDKELKSLHDAATNHILDLIG